MSDLTFELGDGQKIPAVGFGTFQITDEDVEAAVLSALEAGYRHVDTAEFYRNEKGIGRALARAGMTNKCFVTTKVWPGGANMGPVKGFDDTLQACKASKENLGVECVDLIIMHGPFGGKEARVDQFRALVEAQKQGICTSIGVSNYNSTHLAELIEAGLPAPSCNQIELHPMGQKTEIVTYMQAKNILPIAYSSLVPLASWREGYAKYAGSIDIASKATPSPVSSIASRLAVSEAQVLLRWAVQKGFCVLPKSVREDRIKQNLDLASFALADADMEALDAMECNTAAAFGAPGQAFDPTTFDA
eukprot:CAMPEP_0117495798 /NCGR_PEP_ID=MMETSP0784-20121206/20320_1 /TAXON_ID=39447 /ORGANISM="" /LENGTH=303 /DNA_ID=CAMNT_0005290735 /DNA_START=86 /DNA_END=997 /DNA_ORIENTATION=+